MVDFVEKVISGLSDNGIDSFSGNANDTHEHAIRNAGGDAVSVLNVTRFDADFILTGRFDDPRSTVFDLYFGDSEVTRDFDDLIFRECDARKFFLIHLNFCIVPGFVHWVVEQQKQIQDGQCCYQDQISAVELKIYFHVATRFR